MIPQAEELQRLEAERRSILSRRAPQLLEQPAEDSAAANGDAGGLRSCANFVHASTALWHMQRAASR